jgi:hypothetical protein
LAVEPSQLLVPVIHLVTLLITGMSALYVYRQRTTEYPQVRNLLVMVHVFYMGVVSLEFARTFVPVNSPQTNAFLTVYTISNTTFVLADVLLLTLVAVAIYYRPNGKGMADILKELGKHQTGATLLGVYVLYIAVAEGYLVAAQPFTPAPLRNIVGDLVISTQFNQQYLAMLLGILAIFILYPSYLLLASRERTGDVQVRKAFAILPVAWVGIGIDLLIFNGFLLNPPISIDASAIGYLFAAVAFSATAATFRRATLLSAFFQPGIAATGITPPASSFSGRLGIDKTKTMGRVYLMEVDPSSKFEDPVSDFATELGSEQHVVFAFTAAGSPIHNALEGMANVRFFTMTRKVSYPKPGEKPDEVLVPTADQSVLLNVLDKAITSNPDLKFGVIFDSISDLVLTSGLEMTYKFLKQANEMLGSNKVTSVFLLTSGAHSEREVNVVKSLFGNIITFGNGQLTIQKST